MLTQKSPSELSDIWLGSKLKSGRDESIKPTQRTVPVLEILKNRGASSIKTGAVSLNRSLFNSTVISSFWMEIFVGSLAGLLIVFFVLLSIIILGRWIGNPEQFTGLWKLLALP
jgi:hypothetical protein